VAEGTPPRRVVVTGVATRWGGELARALERDPAIEAVIGIDDRPPLVELERTELLDIDIRNPALSRLLPTTCADTVVHCGILWYPEPDKPARTLHDVNVIGTLQLLTACERTRTLRRLVVRGSAAIYGCEPSAPLFFTEELAGTMPLRTRFQRDVAELEGYFETFARRRPEVDCCMLRFQPELGVGLEAPLARYLSLPVVPTQLGFDPRLQPLHPEDATGALVAAVRSRVRGAVNVAPSGAISLSRILRLAGRPSLPLPYPLFAPAFGRLARELGAGPLFADAVRLLRFGRGVSNRRLVEEVGYKPRYDAAAVAADFAEGVRGRGLAAPLDLADLAERAARALR
jgi:UDP-glucose 4-epimerase